MDAAWLDKLNPQQRAAATHPAESPLLIIAGAGTGKTNTLAHRVAYLISTGIDPGRILLLTFTRRAAAEMTRRVENILREVASCRLPVARKGGGGSSSLATGNWKLATTLWGGTFHAMGNRLVRVYGESLGLGENFTVIDRSDAEDLLNDVRSELNLDKGEVRFPKKATCLSIYSRCVNASEPIEQALKSHFPWCMNYPQQLKKLFSAYV